MSKLDDLIQELSDEADLSTEEAEALRDAMAERKRRGQLAKVEQPKQEIDFPSSPQSGQRGIAMYGNETPAQAYERWMEQEMHDPEGAYGPGGMTGGGIFGDGSVSMPDYDPNAHRRTEGRVSQMANIKMVQVLERMERRLEASERREAERLLEERKHRRLGRGGGGKGSR